MGNLLGVDDDKDGSEVCKEAVEGNEDGVFGMFEETSRGGGERKRFNSCLNLVFSSVSLRFSCLNIVFSSVISL